MPWWAAGTCGTGTALPMRPPTRASRYCWGSAITCGARCGCASAPIWMSCSTRRTIPSSPSTTGTGAFISVPACGSIADRRAADPGPGFPAPWSRAPPAARQYGLPGHRHRRHGHGTEFHVRGHEVLVGAQELVPRDLLPGVGGLPSHDRAARSLGHLPALVQWLARADARDQVGVLLHVGVGPGALRIPAPRRRARDDGVRVRFAARADYPLGDVRRRAVDLAAHGEHVHAVRVLEVDREVIIDVPVRGIGAPLPPAHPDRLHRMRAERPVCHIDVVDVLLHDVVA